MRVVTEIGPGELKKYISSSKSASIMPTGCRLPARTGKVTFNFSDFENISCCKLRFQRVAGNGKVLVSVGGQLKPILVAAKHLVYSIDLSESREVEISRPHDSVGEVFITSIVFDSEEVREPQVSNNWKHLIGQCGKYSCLRLIKGRLFASSGGFIEKGDKIRHLETDPPNSFRNDNGKIVFKGSCEITNLILVDAAAPQQAKQPFVDRKPAQQIEVGQNEEAPPAEHVPRPNSGKPRPAPTHVVDGSLAGIEEDIVFDSNAVNFNKIVTSRSKIIKSLRSLGKDYLLLKPSAHFTIPLGNIQPSKDYILILYGKSLNGNGKIRVGLSPTEYYYGDTREIMLNRGNSSKYVGMKSDGGASLETQRLHLMLPTEVCTGEVLISRIVVINNIDIHNSGRRTYDAVKVAERAGLESDGSFDLAIPNATNDKNYLTVKKYARYYTQKMDNGADQFFQGSLVVSTASGMSWFNKMKTMFPHIVVAKNNNPDLSISQPGFIKPAPRVWLDVGNDITNDDAKQLSGAKAVYSPSVRICQQLETKLSGTKIEVLRKPMPWIAPKEIGLFKRLDYVVLFNRARNSTAEVVKIWNNKLPKLVVVGARGSFPGYVVPTNEYLEYAQLVYVMMNAKCIVDLPENIDYESSLLGLAEAVGTPTVTTNWSAMEKKNSLFLVKQKVPPSSMPAAAALMEAVEEACAMNPQPLDRNEYNNSELMKFKKMFS